MYGHWQSGTRKLNKHWQSVIMNSILRMRNGSKKIAYKSRKSIDELSYKMTREIKDGKVMYSSSNLKQGKVYLVKYGAASKVDVVSLGGTGMKYILDNGDELKDSDKYFLGFQVTAYMYNKTGTTEVWNNTDTYDYNHYEGKWTIPKEGYYTVARPLSSLNQTSQLVSSYKQFSNKLKHDTSQFGNSKFVGNSNYTSHIWRAIDGGCVLETGLTTWKGTGDDTEVLCKDGFMDYIMSINGDYFLKNIPADDSKSKEIPKIGVTMGFMCLNIALQSSSKIYYLITPTIYDREGNIADLSDK